MRPVEILFEKIFSPLANFSYQQAIHLKNGLEFLLITYDLKQENRKLTEAVLKLHPATIELAQLKLENKALRQELDFLSANNLNGFGADIITKDQLFKNQFFSINRGSKDGVKAGMPATALGGHLIGVVTETKEAISVVQPITNPKTNLAAYIESQSKIQGVVKGDIDFSLTMELVPVDSGLKLGQAVLTSGLDPLIPRGLIIGKITSIKTPEAEIFPEIKITQDLDFQAFISITVMTYD